MWSCKACGGIDFLKIEIGKQGGTKTGPHHGVNITGGCFASDRCLYMMILDSRIGCLFDNGARGRGGGGDKEEGSTLVRLRGTNRNGDHVYVTAVFALSLLSLGINL